MSNEVSAIRKSVEKGDMYQANLDYSAYAASMQRSGQTPKPKSYFGIKG